MIGLNRDLVELHPYDPTWHDEFLKEEKILKNLLKGYDFQIEHVGSTSIPGLSAKPVIDIAIGVKKEENILKFAEILQREGYDVKNNLVEKGEILACKGKPECRTHHVHMQTFDSEYWGNFMYFKKYLLDHPEKVKEYENLKIQLATTFANERKKYTAAKNDFIVAVLTEAKKIYKL